MKRTLGTQLRHLVELLDSAVERAYADVGLDYRARYTPVMRVLIDQEAATVSEIAASAAITQPAATQTIGRMVEAGIVSVATGAHDARQRIVRLTAKGKAMLPELARCWQATAMAAQSLDRELRLPLGELLDQAAAAREQRSNDERIRQARAKLGRGDRHGAHRGG
jgi:DNA-binding MarR family transcriptional regulator